MIKAVYIPVDLHEDVKIVEDLFNDYTILQTVVGGMIEYLSFLPGVHAYINEEGKLNGMQYNQRATRLFREIIPHDIIVGPMILLGDDGEGGEADITDDAIQRIKQLLSINIKGD